jgi:hypothetical protein
MTHCKRGVGWVFLAGSVTLALAIAAIVLASIAYSHSH